MEDMEQMRDSLGKVREQAEEGGERGGYGGAAEPSGTEEQEQEEEQDQDEDEDSEWHQDEEDALSE